MASTTGGQFLFARPIASGQAVTLGLTADGTVAPFPGANGANFNIEVFTSVSGGTLPALASGFNAGIIDTGVSGGAAPNLVNGFLTGAQLKLFTGDYDVSDVPGGSFQSPALITLGSGNQTVHGAAGDTLVGGSGNQQLDGLRNAGAETIVGGTGSYAIFGGVGDVISGSAASTSTTFGQVVGTAGGMTITLPTAGNYIISSGKNNNIKAAAGNASVILTGAAGDTIDMTGNTGTEILIGSTVGGGDKITGGGGNVIMVGSAGDTLISGTGVNNVFGNGQDGKGGGVRIIIGASGTNVVSSGAADTITALPGNASVLLQGAAGDTVNMTGNTGNEILIGAFAGGGSTIPGSQITGGGGNVIMVGGAGDTLFGGTGTSNIFGNGLDGKGGGVRIVIGASGSNVIQSATGDTVTAGSGSATALIGGAKGDTINLTGNTGTLTVIGTAGSELITAGDGKSTIFGGAGDTINTGIGNTYVDALPGKMLVNIGSGSANIIGSTVAAAGFGDTFTGGSGSLNFNAGGGTGDFINLAGSTGNAVINTFSFGAGADTINASNGADTVFGGPADRIAAGTKGTLLADHSTTVAGASIGFGVNAALGSTANVTVTNFAHVGATPTDFVFYANETAATNSSIVASSTTVTVDGVASTKVSLPDGTSMTLVGVAKVDFNVSYFKV